MKITSLLYRAARMSAWSRAISKAAAGNPRPLARRIVDRPIYRAAGDVPRAIDKLL